MRRWLSLFIALLFASLCVIQCQYKSDCLSYDGACDPAISYLLYARLTVSPAGNPNATTPSSVSGVIYLFRTTSQTTGLLGGIGGRTGADSLCASSRSSYVFTDNSCTSVRAFISIAGGDQISNLTSNYGVPSANPIQGPTSTLISPNWPSLISGTISNSLQAAGVLPGATAWASYSTSIGTLAGNNCTNGTVTGVSGQVGNSSFTNSQWMDNGTGLCALGNYLVCACY